MNKSWISYLAPSYRLISSSSFEFGSGISSINSFVLSSAIEKAKQIIEREQTLQLSARDASTLMAALDRPATANAKLQAAFARYDEQR